MQYVAGRGLLLECLSRCFSLPFNPEAPPAVKRRGAEALENRPQKSAWSFQKSLAVVGASIALAAFDKQPVSDLSISVFAARIGYLITYAGKSAFEKSSRNKYHLDEDGKPFDGGSDQEGE